MRNVSDKSCIENQSTHFVFSKVFFYFEIRAVYEITREKYCRAGQSTDDDIIQRMRIACLMTKATNTHSEYVILFAFPLQQWLHERALLLRYTYIASTSPFPPRTSVFSSQYHPWNAPFAFTLLSLTLHNVCNLKRRSTTNKHTHTHTHTHAYLSIFLSPFCLLFSFRPLPVPILYFPPALYADLPCIFSCFISDRTP